MSLVLDIIVLSIIILCVAISAKRGFVKALTEALGFAAAVAAAMALSSLLAAFTYDKIIEPPLISAVSEKNTNAVTAVTDELWEELPGFISGAAQKAGITRERLNGAVEENINGGVRAAAEATSREIIRPVTVSVLKLIYSVVLMLLLFMLVRLLSRPINRLFSIGPVGRLNRFLGALTGALKGAAFSVLFCTALALAVSLSKDGFWIFTPDNIRNSHIFNFFALCDSL